MEFGIEVKTMKAWTFNDWLKKERLHCEVVEKSANDWVAVLNHCTIRSNLHEFRSANGFGSTCDLALEALITKLKDQVLRYQQLDGIVYSERDIECPTAWNGLGLK